MLFSVLFFNPNPFVETLVLEPQGTENNDVNNIYKWRIAQRNPLHATEDRCLEAPDMTKLIERFFSEVRYIDS